MTTKTYDKDPLGILEDSTNKDPLGILTGESVKKKEPPTLSASASASGVGYSDGLVPLEGGDEAFRQFKERNKRYEEPSGVTVDASDPIGTAKKAILRSVKKPRITSAAIVSSTGVKRPLDEKSASRVSEGISFSDASKDLKAVENYYRYDTNRSLGVLKKATGLSDDQLYSDAYDGQIQQALQKGNATQRVAYETLQEAKKANKVISEGGTIADMAVRLAGLSDPAIQAQIDNQREQSPIEEQMFGKGTVGRFMFDAMNNPAFQNEIKKNPALAKELRQEAANLVQHYPQFGKAFYGNMISQEMEKLGINNGILNVVTKDEFDKVVKSLKDKGEITLAEEAFINDNLRSDTGLKGLGKQVIGREDISTPGLVENTLQGGFAGVENLGKGVAELTGARSLLQNEQEALKTDVERLQTDVNVKPESTWHEITQTGGKILGQSLSIGGGGGLIKALKIAKNPAVALGLSGGLQAYANYAPEARMLFPGEQLKQRGYATIMSGIEALTENIFRDDKVVKGLLKDFKPLVQNTIEDFTQKNISAAAAQAIIEKGVKGIIAKVPEAATAFGKAAGQNVAEEFAAGALGGITQGVFEGKPMSEWLDAEDLSETVKMAALGSPFIAALATRADMMKSKGITSKQIYLMARDPEYWAGKMQEMSKLDEDLATQLPDKLQNLQYASDLLKELDTQEGMTEKQKAKYLLTSLDSKIRQDNLSTKTDPILKAKEDAETVMAVQQNEQVKQDIVDDKDDGTYEGDISDDINKDEIKAAKILAKEELPGIYGEMAAENPVAVLQEIAQQAQGIDAEGKMLEGGARKEDMIKQGISEKVIDEAVKLYPAPQEPSSPMTNQEGVRESASPSISEEGVVAGDSGEVVPPTPTSSGVIFSERPGTELSFRGLQNVANEFGYEDVRSRDTVSDIQERQNARQTADEWKAQGVYERNIQDLLTKINAREMVPTAKQRLILQQYLANKAQQLRETTRGTQEYSDRLADVERIKQIGQIARQEAGAALRIPEGGQSHPVADFGDAIVAMADAIGTTELTEDQQKEVDDLVKNYEQKDKDAQAKIAELETKLSEMEAAKEVKQEANKKKSVRKKTAEQYKDERAKLREELKAAKKEHDDWMKSQGIQSMGVSFSMTPKMVKVIGKIAGSYVDELGDNIAEITNRVLSEIQEFFPGATEKDVHDVISGAWDKEIERIEAATKRNEKATADLKDKTANKDFEKQPPKRSVFDNPELKKKFPELYKQALDALTAREDAKRDFDVALAKAELAKRSKTKKLFDIGKGIVATSKAIASGIDFSAIFMQNLVAMAAHPRSAIKALPASFIDAAKEKAFTRWLTELHNSSNWDLIEKSGLNITDPKSLREEGKEEAFVGNLLDKKFKIKGKTYQISKIMTKPFERQFTSLGNRMRVNMFLRAAERWQKDKDNPKTFETHPELYKSLARMLNTETGRGGVPDNVKKSMENITPIIWSPRLIASRLNLLGLSDLAFLTGKKGYYAGLDPEVRKMAIGDLAKFIGFGVAVLLVAGNMGGDVDDDPESPTFGTFKFGNKNYNVWGGFTPYVKTIWQSISGKRKAGDKEKKTTSGELALKYFRSRLTPFAGTVTNVLMGKDYSGKRVMFEDAVKSSFMPISVKGITEGLEKDGVAGIMTQGIPSIVGIGVSDERDFARKPNLTIYEKGKKRTATIEEEEKYNKLRDSLKEKKLASVIDKGAYIDKYGDVTLDKGKKKKTVKYDTLDEEQIKDLNESISRQATYEAKKQLKWDKK